MVKKSWRPLLIKRLVDLTEVPHMTAKLFAFCCGTLTCPREALIDGGEGVATLPVPSFLIEHPKGRAIYDTGMHPS